jgi:hypothetical protein
MLVFFTKITNAIYKQTGYPQVWEGFLSTFVGHLGTK